MRAVIQRVSEANISVGDSYFEKINQGLLILLGVEHNDRDDDINFLVSKILNMRIFSDENQKMNLSLLDIDGDILIISQFTLYGNCKKGNRPSFVRSANYEKGEKMYEKFVDKVQSIIPENKVQTGVFGASMKIDLTNDGPVTIIVDSKNMEL